MGLGMLVFLALQYGMRPPRDSPLKRKLRMLANLRRMHTLNLAQYEADQPPPYSPSNLRKILQVLAQLEAHLGEKLTPDRYRLRHLVERIEHW